MAQDTGEVPFIPANGRACRRGSTITRDGTASSVYLIRGDRVGAFVATVPRAAMTLPATGRRDVRAARERHAVGDLGIGE
jgi:hypothetical protein